MLGKAFSSIVFRVSDSVLRKISKETTIFVVWKKLEELYRNKALPNRIYLKEFLFYFKKDENMPVEDFLDEFNALVLDLENLNIKLDEEDKVEIILNSLPKSFKNCKETLKYGRETITIDDIQNALTSKLLDIKSNEKNDNMGEGLTVRGKLAKRSVGNRGRSQIRSKYNGKKDFSKVKRYHCNKLGHIRRLCPERTKAQDNQNQAEATLVDHGCESVEVLTASSEQF